MIKKITLTVSIFILSAFLFPITCASASTVEVSNRNEFLGALYDESVTEIVITQTIGLWRELELDCSGKTIRVAEPYVNEDGSINNDADEFCMFSINKGYDVTLKNAVIIGSRYPVFIMQNGTLYLENCDISRTTCAVQLNTKLCTAVVTNTTIHDCSTLNAYDGVISANHGLVVMDGCKILNNKNSMGSGAAIYGYDATYYVNNSVFAGNSTNTSTAMDFYSGKGYFMNCSFFGNTHTANEVMRFGSGETILVNCDFVSNYLSYSSTVKAGRTSGKATMIYCVNSLTLNSNITTIDTVTVENTASDLYTAYSGGSVNAPTLSAMVKHGSVMATAGVYATYFDYTDLDDIKMGYKPNSEGDRLVSLGSCALGGEKVETYIDGSARKAFTVGAVKVNENHSFTYDVSENKITATCSNSSCEFHSNPITISISDSRVMYTGEAIPAAVMDMVTALAGNSYSINYKSADEGTYNSSSAPVEVGKYTVKLMYQGKTITGNLEIMNDLVIWAGGKNTKTENYKTRNLDMDYLAELGLNTDIGDNKYLCTVTAADITDPENVFNSQRGSVITSVKNSAANVKFDKKTNSFVITSSKATKDVSVRVWIAEYKKANKAEKTEGEIVSYASVVVTVKVAANKLETRVDDVKTTKLYLSVNESAAFTLFAETKNATISEDATYTVEVQKEQYKNLVKVTDNGNGTYSVKALGLLNGKITKMSLICTNVESGKKCTIQLIISNEIEELAIPENLLNEEGAIELQGPGDSGKAASATLTLTSVNSDGTTGVTASTGKIACYITETSETEAGYTLSEDGKKFQLTSKNKLVSASYKAKTGELTIKMQKTVTSTTAAKLVIVVTAADNTRKIYEYPIVFK